MKSHNTLAIEFNEALRVAHTNWLSQAAATAAHSHTESGPSHRRYLPAARTYDTLYSKNVMFWSLSFYLKSQEIILIVKQDSFSVNRKAYQLLNLIFYGKSDETQTTEVSEEWKKYMNP
jgi:hypothetical protein